MGRGPEVWTGSPPPPIWVPAGGTRIGGHGVMVAWRRVLAVEVLNEGAVGVPEREDGLCLLGGLLARMGALKAGRGTAESSEPSLRGGLAVLCPRALVLWLIMILCW